MSGTPKNGAETRVLADAQARRRIEEDLDATLFVEAAAGTGKTSALVSRIVALLRTGTGTLDKIVAVTFTEKAAGEMKLRLRSEIEKARQQAETDGQPEVRARLDEALGQLELARIGTIHAFCGDLLHERPVEAGVDPLFEVAPQDEQSRLLDRAFESWFQTTLSDPPEGVRRLLRRRPRGRDGFGPKPQLRQAAENLIEHRDFPAAFARVPFDRAPAIDAVMEELASLGSLAKRATSKNDYLGQNLRNIERFVDETLRREQVRERDYDGLEAELRDLAKSYTTRWKYRGRGKLYGQNLPRGDVIAQRDAAKDSLDQVVAASDADMAAALREDLRPVVAAYEEAKRSVGKLDFLDLLVRARDLVQTHAEARAELQQRFSHFFVDEFQDTDPLQVEILLLLAADDPSVSDPREATPSPGKLFLVGDPKQSIYRFRRADVAIYEDVKRRLVTRGAEVVHLSTSFRGVPSLQRAVNAAFEPHMQGDQPGVPEGAQAEYVPLEPFREEPTAQPALVGLPVPRPYGDYGTVVNFRIEDSMPHAVGAFVDWLVNQSGWQVEDRNHPGKMIPVGARHVCLLFRRFKKYRDDVSRGYVRALEARRIPHVLVGGRSFHDREEVLAIRNSLCAIEWPDDELRVFATLRGPLFALGDDALLAFRAHFKRLHPLAWLALEPGPPSAEDSRLEAAARLNEKLEGLDDATREVAGALAILGRLHTRRNRRPIADTISRLLEAVRAHAGIAIWPTGEQALANCLRMIDLARRFERRGAPSFRSFVERMENDAERGESEEAPVVEEGTEGVRIMTVHKAKGLEFPVVILCDPTCSAVRDTPSRHVDTERGLWAESLAGCTPRDLLDAKEDELARDAAESVRLTYVAATRARDLLVVPVCGDKPIEGWLDLLDPVIYPISDDRRKSHPAPGCPKFGDDSVYERPERAEKGARFSVKPGRHTPRTGEHAVVWWDPHTLELDREADVGLRQQRILEADASGAVAEEGVRANDRWQQSRQSALQAGAIPSILVAPVTQLAEEVVTSDGESPAAVAPDSEVELQEVPGDRLGRPAGARFGTLVHAVLATIDLAADSATVQATAAVQGRLVGASEAEVAAAAGAVSAALEHTVLQRAAESAAAGTLRRETPVWLVLEDGSLAEGIVDLAFRQEDGSGGAGSKAACWIVVDFKTDRDLTTHREQYDAQVKLYAEAVSRATGEPARGILLGV